MNIVFRKQNTLWNKIRESTFYLIKWSSIGHSLLIVEQLNLYFIKDASNPENAKQLTFTGGFDIYNGIPD